MRSGDGAVRSADGALTYADRSMELEPAMPMPVRADLNRLAVVSWFRCCYVMHVFLPPLVVFCEHMVQQCMLRFVLSKLFRLLLLRTYLASVHPPHTGVDGYARRSRTREPS